MNSQNMTLLSQEEIDTLLEFLNLQKESLSTAVLDQAGIDKLISIIKSSERNRMNLFVHPISPVTSCNTCKKLINCLLQVEFNLQNDFLEIYALNESTGEKVKLTPTCLDKLTLSEDDSTWGYCISPFVFDNIASCFNMKYTKDTYDSICSRFVTKTFGIDDLTLIPNIYIPSDESIRENLKL